MAGCANGEFWTRERERDVLRRRLGNDVPRGPTSRLYPTVTEPVDETSHFERSITQHFTLSVLFVRVQLMITFFHSTSSTVRIKVDENEKRIVRFSSVAVALLTLALTLSGLP